LITSTARARHVAEGSLGNVFEGGIGVERVVHLSADGQGSSAMRTRMAAID
jgi:hypothetical protein